MKIVKLLLLLLVTRVAQAQVCVQNSDRYAAIKSGTLYMQLGDTTAYAGRNMAAAIRSVWTVSKLVFIPPGTISPSLLLPGNFFVTGEHNNRSFNFVRYQTNVDKGSPTWKSDDVNNDYFFLQLWGLADNYKTGNTLKESDKAMIARAELYLKTIGEGKTSYTSLTPGTKTFDIEFCNGLPGYIKNIFQNINNCIRDNVVHKLKNDIDAMPGLVSLQKDTLYVPNYWYGPGDTMLPNEPENSANGKYLANMLSSYDFAVKLVRRDVLSQMILDAKKGLYYFNYVQSSADKMVSIVNGQTGEVLFYNFNDKSYRPKPKDFKQLSAAVAGAK